MTDKNTAEASGPTAPIPKDPQPSVDRIDELARRILSADILLPRFQREFVWSRAQVLKLLDSIARNYPVGSVLLWQSRQELRSENRIGDLEIELPKPDYPVNYLLDGQQRLSTICGALYWQGDNESSMWNVAYDLRSQLFFYPDSLEDLPLHQVRMNELADAAVFFRHIAGLESLSAEDKAELKTRAELLFKRFKDYKIATDVPSSRINALANFVMLSSASNKTITNRAPSDYLRDVEAAAGDSLKSWLDTNLISEAAFAAGKADNFDKFLTLRSETINQTVMKLARW